MVCVSLGCLSILYVLGVISIVMGVRGCDRGGRMFLVGGRGGCFCGEEVVMGFFEVGGVVG